MNGADHDTIRVEILMRELEEQVRSQLRRQLIAQGGAREYEDPRIFESVERVLHRASERSGQGGLLLPELIGDDPEWRLQMPLRFATHRPAAGRFVLFVKQRILLPLTRWLYEYALHNFERQQRLNLILISCVEELAIENARLRRDVARLDGEP